MRNPIIPFRWQTILVGIVLGFFVEFLPVFWKNYEKLNRFFYALIALYVTILIETHLNKKKFRKSLVSLVKNLKVIRIQFEDKATSYKIKPEIIQAIMKAVIAQLSGVLEQTENLRKEFRRDLYQESGNLHCSICDTKHLTDIYSKCQNCKVPSNFWKGAEM
jgi:hypothetical protein